MGSAFRAASKNVINKDELTVKDFAEMMQEAVLGIQKLESVHLEEEL